MADVTFAQLLAEQKKTNEILSKQRSPLDGRTGAGRALLESQRETTEAVRSVDRETAGEIIKSSALEVFAEYDSSRRQFNKEKDFESDPSEPSRDDDRFDGQNKILDEQTSLLQSIAEGTVKSIESTEDIMDFSRAAAYFAGEREPKSRKKEETKKEKGLITRFTDFTASIEKFIKKIPVIGSPILTAFNVLGKLIGLVIGGGLLFLLAKNYDSITKSITDFVRYLESEEFKNQLERFKKGTNNLIDTLTMKKLRETDAFKDAADTFFDFFTITVPKYFGPNSEFFIGMSDTIFNFITKTIPKTADRFGEGYFRMFEGILNLNKDEFLAGFKLWNDSLFSLEDGLIMQPIDDFLTTMYNTTAQMMGIDSRLESYLGEFDKIMFGSDGSLAAINDSLQNLQKDIEEFGSKMFKGVYDYFFGMKGVIGGPNTEVFKKRPMMEDLIMDYANKNRPYAQFPDIPPLPRDMMRDFDAREIQDIRLQKLRELQKVQDETGLPSRILIELLETTKELSKNILSQPQQIAVGGDTTVNNDSSMIIQSTSHEGNAIGVSAGR